MKTVKDVMSVQPISVRETVPFKELVVRLRRFQLSAFPVVDQGGRVIGVVSEADLLAREALSGRRGIATGIVHHTDLSKAGGRTAGDLMTSPAVTVTPDDSIEKGVVAVRDHIVANS